MAWITANKDFLALLISAIGLVVSIIALWKSLESASLAKQAQNENTLGEFQENIVKPGRDAMSAIWSEWNARYALELETLSETQKEKFIDHYNSCFHHAPDKNDKALSDHIHVYLRELGILWDRMQKGEFTEERVMKRLGYGIYKHDRYLIPIYLSAHWKDEGVLDLEEEKRFWCNAPKMVELARSWQSR